VVAPNKTYALLGVEDAFFRNIRLGLRIEAFFKQLDFAWLARSGKENLPSVVVVLEYVLLRGALLRINQEQAAPQLIKSGGHPTISNVLYLCEIDMALAS